MFDLIIFPLSLDAGREQYELPGLLVAAAPRRAARMRAQDHLLLYCKLMVHAGGAGGGAGLAPNAAQRHEIMSRLAETYFTSSGSVTSGLTAVVTRLNDFLLNRNLKYAQEGQLVGTLNLAVIHGERLVVAHAGPTHSFVLTKTQVQHYDDGQAGRGLGLGRQATPRFYQTSLETGDLLLVCPEPPATWTAKTLAGSPQLSFDYLRRRLLNEAGVDLQVGVVRFQTGKGQVTYWKPGDRSPNDKSPGDKTHGGRSASRPVPSTPRPGLPSRPLPPAPAAQAEGPVNQPAEGKLPQDQLSVSRLPAPGPFAETAPSGTSGQAGSGTSGQYRVESFPADGAAEDASEGVGAEAAEAETATAEVTGRAEIESGKIYPELDAEDDLPSAPRVELAPPPVAPAQEVAQQEVADAAQEVAHQEIADAAQEVPGAQQEARQIQRPAVQGVARERVAARAAAARRAAARDGLTAEGSAGSGARRSRRAKTGGLSGLFSRFGRRPAKTDQAADVQSASSQRVAAQRSAGQPDIQQPLAGEQRPMQAAVQAQPKPAPARQRPAVSRPKTPGQIQKGSAALRQKTRQALQRVGPVWTRAGRAISGAVEQVFPRQRDAQGNLEPFFNISPGRMLTIAILIPLLVVTMAVTVYFQSGRTAQFQQFFLQAQQYAQLAAQQTDPVQQREGWKRAYALLLDADKYGSSDEESALKKQAIEALDTLEGYVRLDYQPALSGQLPQDVKITRIIASHDDVYLLDSSQGRVLRMFRTATGYELDPKFTCGPSKAGAIIIESLIDIVAMPSNNQMHSSVMGIDKNGNLAYCSPSLSGVDSKTLALPDNGWGTIMGISLYNNALYVLDPKGNAVYRYDGSDGVFADRPHLYFDDTIPQMNDVVDLEVDQEFLYLLHSDGRMTVCESSGFAFAATKCTDPTPYGDSRSGYEPAPLTFLGSKFVQIQTTQPPDPSLFALDAANKSIYHLSLRRLNLQRQYRELPDGNFPLPNSAPTAFAISPNRRALLAFGNQVFFAPIP